MTDPCADRFHTEPSTGIAYEIEAGGISATGYRCPACAFETVSVSMYEPVDKPPVEELRAAATRIREAAGPLPHPWEHVASLPCDGVRTDAGWEVASGSYPDTAPAICAHIALWHPAVALAVAAWLQTTARLVDLAYDGRAEGLGSALAVARAINGGAP